MGVYFFFKGVILICTDTVVGGEVRRVKISRRVILLLAISVALGGVAMHGGGWSLMGSTVMPEASSQSTSLEPGVTQLYPSPQESFDTGSVGEYRLIWRYGGREWSYELNVSPAVQGYYSNRTRPGMGDYSVYVTDSVDDEVLGALASSFRKRSELEGFSSRESVEFVASFVQSLRYTPDSVSTSMDEYPRYPVETLVENGGDCEDTAILLSAVLNEMGYDVVLLELPSHMAVGVAGNWTGKGNGNENGGRVVEHRGREYWYVETTGDGWSVGEVPEQLLDDPVTVRSLEPTPVLRHSWDAVLTEGVVDVTVTVESGLRPGRGDPCKVPVRGLRGERGSRNQWPRRSRNR